MVMMMVGCDIVVVVDCLAAAALCSVVSLLLCSTIFCQHFQCYAHHLRVSMATSLPPSLSVLFQLLLSFFFVRISVSVFCFVQFICVGDDDDDEFALFAPVCVCVSWCDIVLSGSSHQRLKRAGLLAVFLQSFMCVRIVSVWCVCVSLSYLSDRGGSTQVKAIDKKGISLLSSPLCFFACDYYLT